MRQDKQCSLCSMLHNINGIDIINLLLNARHGAVAEAAHADFNTENAQARCIITGQTSARSCAPLSCQTNYSLSIAWFCRHQVKTMQQMAEMGCCA